MGGELFPRGAGLPLCPRPLMREKLRMTVPEVLLAVYLSLSLLYWLLAIRCAVLVRRSVPLLSETDAPPPVRWRRLSVVVPACNEADKLAAAARTLLAEDYADLELVLVDDRSTDATGEIIDSLAARDGRVRAVHVTELPPGWLGKVHALNAGLAHCTGDFLLFTDADVHFRGGMLRRAVALCERDGLDHLTAFPKLWPATVLLDSVISVFVRQLLMAARPWAVSDAASRAFMGIGAFNLVRRSAFEATDGFEWLRLEVADDMGLGLMMKRSGARCGVVSGVGLLGMHWYGSLAEAVRGAEKGWATVSCFSIPRTVAMALVVVGLELSPVLSLLPVALGVRSLPAWGGVAVPAAFVCSAVLLARWAGARILPILVGCLTAPLVVAAMLRAAVLGRRRGGVMWRGTLYTEETLRGGARVRFP